jgi:cAMP phosphodiesterase
MTDVVGFQTPDALAFEKDIAGSDREEIADAVEDGRLTRTVWADEAEDLPFFHLESDIIHCQEPSKGFDQFFQL